jgi:hypothetical protein
MVVGSFCSFSFIVCMGNRSFRVSLGRTVALSNGAWDCMGRNVRVYRGVPGNRTLVVDKKNGKMEESLAVYSSCAFV